jgi:hypothetical protein
MYQACDYSTSSTYSITVLEATGVALSAEIYALGCRVTVSGELPCGRTVIRLISSLQCFSPRHRSGQYVADGVMTLV